MDLKTVFYEQILNTVFSISNLSKYYKYMIKSPIGL